MDLFSTSKIMTILNQSNSKVYSKYDWIEAQIMIIWNAKIILGASAKTLRNSVFLLLHIWHHKKTPMADYVAKIEFACARQAHTS